MTVGGIEMGTKNGTEVCWDENRLFSQNTGPKPDLVGRKAISMVVLVQPRVAVKANYELDQEKMTRSIYTFRRPYITTHTEMY